MTWWPDMTIRPLTRYGATPDNARVVSSFKAGIRQTLELLDRELYMLNARSTVLELAIRDRDLRQDGKPRADAKLESPAVALSFNSSGKGRLRFAADRFTDWQDNLRAIALGLEALRKVDRYGITSAGEQYAGWKAIENTASDPLDVLRSYAGALPRGLADTPRELYAAAVRRVHPDIPETGNRAAFDAVQEARRQLERRGDW